MRHLSYSPVVKRLLAGLAFILCAVSASAQVYYLNVFGKDGSRTRYEISNLDSIKLSYEQAPIQGLKHVDLGLSVEWASFNVGATNPYEPGNFFAFGETEPKETYTRQTYKYYDPNILNGYTKYNFHSKYGKVDYKYRLDMEDDAARANWGSDWRMPTIEEMAELVEMCYWEWISDTTKTGFKGYKVTGPNGNYIYLPVAQYRDDEQDTPLNDEYGVASYISSSLYPGDTWSAIGIDIEYESYKGIWYTDYYISPEGRMFGELVRPVYSWKAPENVSPITHFDLLEKAVTLKVGDQYKLKFEMDSSTWAAPVLTVPNGLNYYGSDGIMASTPGTYVVTANLGDFVVELTVVVTEPEIVAEGVDLGLSVKWATCNVGSETPSGYGYSYAWGETKPKTSFSLNNYAWFDTTKVVYTKYTSADGKKILDAEDDAAHKLWGDNWRIPSMEEYMELVENCSWEWIELEDGVTGYKITSLVPGYTDKYIFLPAAGYNAGFNQNYVGYYWLSSISEKDEAYAQYIFFNTRYSGDWGEYYRSQGRSIRPVIPFEATDVDTLMIDNEEISLAIGESQTISLIGMTATGRILSVEGGDWTSDNEEVATVKDGVIVAEGAGVCNISVVVGNDTLTCSVTVYDPDAVEYVDLGLSVLWATRNVGAQKPEDIGGYYAWGESVQKSEYSSMTYSWYSGDSIKKYNIAPSKGEVDNKYRLDPEDDAARVIKGDGWRTPTREEFQELMDNCNWIPTVKNGVKGFQVISVVNNNSIFMPLAGEFWDSDTLGLGEYAYYYSNTLDLGIGSYSQAAYAVSMYIDASDYDCYEDTYNRRGGLPIRPVYSTDDYPQNVLEVSGIILDDHKLTIETGESFMPYAEVVEASGVEMHALWKSDNIAVARVADNGAVLGISEGQCNIIAYYGDYADTCVLTVVESVPLIEYVDLGLSVNWATCNIGASSPEYIGNYYAWGETETKSTFEWSNYKFADGPDFLMTKYCSKPEYGLNGFTDGLMTLTPDDDVAHVTWGGNWRMPTYEEFNELIQNCSFRWSYMNGMTGYTVTSKVEGYTDKSIFLPACQDEGQVFLWTSSVGINNNSFASLLYGNSLRYIIARCNGMPVRPVCTKEEIQEPQEPFLVFKYKNLIREVGNTTWLSFDTNVEDDVIFKSSNDSVAVVSEYGQLTTIAEGECIITITAGELSDTCYVTVLDNSSKPQYSFFLDEDSTYCYFSYTVGGLGHGAMAEFYISDQEVGKIPSDICTSYKAYDIYPTDEAALAAYNVLKDSLSAEVIAEMELTVYDGVVMRTVSEQIGRAKYLVIADMKAEYQGFFPSIPNDSIYNPEEPIVIPETPDSIIIVAEHDFIISEDSLAAEFYYRTADEGFAMAATFGPDSTGAIVCTSILFSITLSAEEAQEAYENMTAELTDEFIDSLNVVFNDEGTGFSYTNPKVIGMDRDAVLAMMYQSYKSMVDPEIHEEPVVEEGYIGRVQAYLPAEYADSSVIAAWYQSVDGDADKMKIESVFLFEDGTLVATQSKFYSFKDGRDPEYRINGFGSYEMTEGDFNDGVASVVLSDGTVFEAEIEEGVLSAMGSEFYKQKNEAAPQPMHTK